MTLTQLRYLVAIADSGLNITLAAERVHATQPGLSKQLKQLEDELGFQLFVRKGRSLEAIAPAGAKVIEHARRILAEAGEGVADADVGRQEDVGVPERPARASGLANLVARARQHGGTCTVTARPEGGTRVEWTARLG